MRALPLHRWDRNDCLGLPLFAQRCHELLFDYTLDSYRAPVLNTHSRCVELIDAVAAVRNRELKPQALDSIVEELADSLASDEVAIQLLGPAAEELKSNAFWDTKDLASLRTKARFVRERFDHGRYRDALTVRLRDLLPKAEEKDRILALTRDLIVEWINDKYPKGSLYFYCLRLFYDPTGPKIEGLQTFDDFTALFNAAPRKWTVVVRASTAFLALKRILDPGTVQVLEDPPGHRTPNEREHAFLAPSEDTVFLVQQETTTTALAARISAEAFIAFVSDLARIHAHKMPLTWDSAMLVYDEANHFAVLDEPTSALLKHGDCRRDELTDRFADTVIAFSEDNIEERSRNRFWKTLNLHSTALQSAAVENQLVNLWSAIETMLPLDAAESRIAKIVDLMVPVLGRSYPMKLLKALHDQLLEAAEPHYRDALASVTVAQKEIHAAAALLALEDHWPRLNPVFDEVSANPLLCNRIWQLAKLFSQPKLLRQAIAQHDRRVRWHLHRIYRCRNFATHSGRRLPYAAGVVENLHSYLHELIGELEKVFATEPHPRSIDGALVLIGLEHGAHRELLNRANETRSSADTYLRYVFGATA